MDAPVSSLLQYVLHSVRRCWADIRFKTNWCSSRFHCWRSWRGFVLIVLLLFNPACRSLSNLLRPYRHEEVRPVIACVQRRIRLEDVVYLDPSAHSAFRYHVARMSFRPRQVVVGQDVSEEWKDVAEDLD